jgi:hypothetical protein
MIDKKTTIRVYEDTWLILNNYRRCGESMNDAIKRRFAEGVIIIESPKVPIDPPYASVMPDDPGRGS